MMTSNAFGVIAAQNLGCSKWQKTSNNTRFSGISRVLEI